MPIKSPVTGLENVSLVEVIDSGEIIRAYALIDLDVSRYYAQTFFVEVYKCNDTGYRFYHPSLLSADSFFYDLLHQRDGYSGLRGEHNLATAFIPPGSSVLEIGSGGGTFLESISSITPNCVGLETNTSAAMVARGRGVHTEVLDICEYASKSEPCTYDVVCSFQVLEHVYNVQDFINCSLQMLRPGGTLIIGVPNNNPYLYRHDKFHALNLPPHHMGLWSTQSLRSLVDYFPLETISIAAEKLSPYELGCFYNIQYNHSMLSAAILKQMYYSGLLAINSGLLALKLHRLRDKLLRVISRNHEGRNILAVYSKVND